MGRSIAEVVAATPFYRDLLAAEIDELAEGLELRRFEGNETLMVQGAASDGAYSIVSGQVLVVNRLPGGGEAMLAELGPGDLVGEMALLMRGGKRTATARALTPVEALFTDRRFFDAALHQLRPASLKVLRRLGLIIADRLRAIRVRSRALVDAAPGEAPFRPLPAPVEHARAPFDVRAFLPVLPCLAEFGPDEIDALYALARVEQVPRGSRLVAEGQPVEDPRLVVRGALLLGQRHGDRLHQLDILGPGRFAGVAPVLEKAPAASELVAAEDCTLLVFDAARFVELWNGTGRMSLHLLEAVNGDLVLSLNTASNHLTRLTAQARVRAIEGEG